MRQIGSDWLEKEIKRTTRWYSVGSTGCMSPRLAVRQKAWYLTTGQGGNWDEENKKTRRGEYPKKKFVSYERGKDRS